MEGKPLRMNLWLIIIFFFNRNPFNSPLCCCQMNTGGSHDLSMNYIEDMNAVIYVPDSDFNDFYQARTPGSFEAGQIWAIYDDDDGMPRLYARILKVVSADGFMVQMIWLKPVQKKVATDSPPKLYQVCGDFRFTKVVCIKCVNIFSHVVAWKKSPKGAIRIVPQTGDIWAVYRDWSSTWDESTPSEMLHSYGIVEILSEFVEEIGLVVSPLVKVEGSFKFVFQKIQVVKLIPGSELVRFSHQVPAKKLSGKEAPDLPNNCWELDPAAIPEDEGNTAETPLEVNLRKENLGLNNTRFEAGQAKLFGWLNLYLEKELLDNLVSKLEGRLHHAAKEALQRCAEVGCFNLTCPLEGRIHQQLGDLLQAKWSTQLDSKCEGVIVNPATCNSVLIDLYICLHWRIYRLKHIYIPHATDSISKVHLAPKTG